MRTRRFVWPLSFTVLLLLGAGARTHAQDPGSPVTPTVPSDRLTVRTHARALAPADDLELEIVVEAGAEDAKEAEKKHRQKLNHVLAALTGKEVAKPTKGKDKDKEDDDEDEDAAAKRKKRKKTDDDEDHPAKSSKSDDDGDAKGALPAVGVADADGMIFDVREARSTVGVQGNTDGQQEDPNQANGEKRAEGEIRVGTAVVVAFRNIAKVPARKLHKLVAIAIDKASEAGADMGGSKTNVKPAIRFRVHDCEGLKRKAYAEALERGKARAAELARLSNRVLGKISCVTELEPQAAAQNQVPEGFGGFVSQLGTNDAGNDDGISTSSEIGVDVALQLEFDLK